jgi:hypothetical protein
VEDVIVLEQLTSASSVTTKVISGYSGYDLCSHFDAKDCC